jgi:transposase
VSRFRSEAAFARHAGVAPVPHWSGPTKVRLRTGRSGNRQLNVALQEDLLGLHNAKPDCTNCGKYPPVARALGLATSTAAVGVIVNTLLRQGLLATDT